MITSLTYTFISPSQIRFSFSSDLESPTFYVYVNGGFVGETLETYWEVSVAPGSQVQFDVFDDPDAVPEEHFPNQFTFRWVGRDGAEAYRVEEYVDSSWVFRGLRPVSLSNLYHYTTPPLEDSTTYQFRVLPLDAEGRTGTALNFTVEMVRYPDTPSQTMEFVGGELSIT